jgi:PAS domain S-box-containing protein
MVMVDNYVDTKQLVTELSSMRQSIAKLEQRMTQDRRPEEPQANLFNNLPSATYVTQDGVFRFVSPRLSHITGYSEPELIGTSPLNLVVSQDRDTVREHALSLLKEERSIVHEFRVITKNAKIRWVVEAASPTLYEGRPATIASLIDITERKQADEGIRKDEDKYHDLCENASDMILCIAPDGRLQYVNRVCRDTLGYSNNEIDYLSLFEIMPRDQVDHCLDLFQRVISGEKVGNAEAVFINNDGSRTTVEGNINCRFDDGKPVYIRGVFRDVTERKLAQEEADALLKEVKAVNFRLEQSNRELEDFAHIASHDLQEPLRKISSFGVLLRDSLEGKLDEDQLENFGFMIEGAGRMQSMIESLLTYSRITTLAKPFQHVDPSRIIQNLINFELVSTLEETKGTIQVLDPLLTVYGDPSQIQQLLQNLIANALKFHRDKVRPIITVSSRLKQNNMVQIDIQDNGIGIDKEYHDQIFVMFKRLHSRTSYPGTGIGLAICKKIVQRHSGEIGIASTPGEGSTFWFTLPGRGYAEEDYPEDEGKSE